MTTQHQWQVTKMAVEPEHDSLKNVVVLAEWKLTSTSEDGKSVQRIGAESFEIEQENFIQFEKLTEQDVLNWIFKNVNKNSIEQTVENDLKQETASLVVGKNLPWNI